MIWKPNPRRPAAVVCSPRTSSVRAPGVYDVKAAPAVARSQAQLIAADLAAQGGVEIAEDAELVAMIAYLQRLGRGPQPVKGGQ